MPRDIWSLLLQSVLGGKAQSVFRFLLIRVKIMTLLKLISFRTYELVPEAYRQQFRKLQKTESQSHVEFARKQACIFAQWCGSQEVKDLEDFIDTHTT